MVNGVRFVVHAAGWWWRHTAGRLACRAGLHLWVDAGRGRTPACGRCIEGGRR